MSDLTRLQSTLSSKYWKWCYFTASECPRSILEALKLNLPHIDSNSWSQRFEFGGIYVNGREVLTDGPLPVPCRLEYYEPKIPIESAFEQIGELKKELIVREDDDIICVYKPRGLSCAPSREQRHNSLKAYVERYLGSQVHMPSRLDTSAQGLVIMSKSKKMHRALQQAFERHSVEKYYFLHVSPAVTWKKLFVENRIDVDPKHVVLRRIVEQGGDSARTFFKAIENVTENFPGDSETSSVPISVILAKPETGRTHQLRVQTSHLGSPIVGDNFYNGVEAEELRLLALRFRFFNPLTKKTEEITVPEPMLPKWVDKKHVILGS